MNCLFTNRLAATPFFGFQSIVVFILFFWTSISALAGELQAPEEVEQSLDYVLSTWRPGGPTAVDQAKIQSLVRYARDIEPGTLLEIRERNETTAAFVSFDLDISLSRLLQYMYDPNIPSYTAMPSSMRTTHWKSVEGHPKGFPLLWEKLDTLESPFLVRGIEHEQITPDINTGTYYGYDLYRSMILLPGRRQAAMSVSMQADRSEVGRKGAVIGDDRDWNYLYSGEEGVNMVGLGWADTYMYSGFSVSVFVETGPAGVRCCIFKWLRAGWSKMNMVKKSHIEKGMERFVADLKLILESPFLPKYSELVERVRQLKELDRQTLENRVRPYFRALLQMDEPILRRAPFDDLLADDTAYLARMQRYDLEKILLHEFLKCRLGRPTVLGPDVCSRYSQVKNPWAE